MLVMNDSKTCDAWIQIRSANWNAFFKNFVYRIYNDNYYYCYLYKLIYGNVYEQFGQCNGNGGVINIEIVLFVASQGSFICIILFGSCIAFCSLM